MVGESGICTFQFSNFGVADEVHMELRLHGSVQKAMFSFYFNSIATKPSHLLCTTQSSRSFQLSYIIPYQLFALDINK
jgi:hypothetical protein